MGVGPTVKKILSEYNGKVRFVVKNYPYKYRDYAFIAALASLAAKEQGKNWEMHDIMLKRSSRLDRESLIKYAKEPGLDVQKFTEAVDSKKYAGEIEEDLAFCHDPEMAFTDGLDISLSYPTTRNWRNSPTLINVGLQRYLFHDGRSLSLDDQALFPMRSAFEMNQNLDLIEEEIRAVPEYVAAFQKVFGGEVTRERLAMALAAFERTLVSRNPPLDRFLKGDRMALSAEAQKGLAVFRGKANCTECHFGPSLSDHKFYALNLPENMEQEKDPRVAATRRYVVKVYHYEDYGNLTQDPGRYLITKDKKDWKAFKTPTLWEISRTGPYMHNGIFSGIDDVIDFFDRGGGPGNTALKPLKLSKREKAQLKVFLVEALTGEEIAVRPSTAP